MVVDGEVVLTDVPVTTLLFLEKQLVDIGTAISAIPTPDAAFTWAQDSTGLLRSDAVHTQKTKKVMKPVTLYEATKEHPAQVAQINEDVVIGTWITTKLSGAMTAERKRLIEGRLRDLTKAVKVAREEANGQEVRPQQLGKKLFDFLLNK